MDISAIGKLLKKLGFKRKGKRFVAPMLEGRAEMEVMPSDQSHDRMTFEATLFVPLLDSNNSVGISPQAFRYLAPGDGPVYEDLDGTWWHQEDIQQLDRLLPPAVENAVRLFGDSDLMVLVYDYLGRETDTPPLPRFQIPDRYRKSLLLGEHWSRIVHLLLSGRFEDARISAENRPQKDKDFDEHEAEWYRYCLKRRFLPAGTIS